MPDLISTGDNLGDHLATKNFKQIKGADIASGDAITLGADGNTYDITGTTTINHINTTNYGVGSTVILHFDGVLQLTNNIGSLSGAEANISLSGGANYTTTAGEDLTFVLHDATTWQEVGRKPITGSITANSTDTLLNKTYDADASGNSLSNVEDANIKASAGIDATKLADGSVTSAEFQYINSLTSNAQTQINTKDTVSGVQDIWIPASAMWANTTSGASALTQDETSTNKQNFKQITFTDASLYVEFTWCPPRNFNNSTLKATFYWIPSSGSGNVTHSVRGYAYGDNANPDATWGSAVAVTDAIQTTGNIHISPQSSAITIGGSPADTKLIQFRIARDSSDSSTGDSKLIGVVLEFSIDSGTAV